MHKTCSRVSGFRVVCFPKIEGPSPTPKALKRIKDMRRFTMTGGMAGESPNEPVRSLRLMRPRGSEPRALCHAGDRDDPELGWMLLSNGCEG